MKNPYEILGVPQDASARDIISAVAVAMRKREYPANDIAKARVVLSRPSQRLAADFTFPVFPKRNKIALIKQQVQATGLTLDKLNPDKYDSL